MSETGQYDPYALLGDFKTKLWLPVYPALTSGQWSIRRIMLPAARGYWGKTYRINGAVILAGPGAHGMSSWMSMTPSEIESQEIGLLGAHGHTVVLGMGMGWLAGNVALKPEVERVTVVERDPHILALIEASGIFQQLPEDARAKLDVVKADALTWKPSGAVDTLQADIWEKFVEPQKLADVRLMQDNIKAKAVYFWGQEMEIWRFACRKHAGKPKLDWPHIRSIVKQDIALPLILSDWEDLPQKIAGAAQWWTPPTPGWWQQKAA
jgi:hypothetical protein